MSKTHVTNVRKLYKLILRLHRSLPEELKILGDNYARDEFKRHKFCKPPEAQTFLNEWRDYALNMSRQVNPTRGQRRQEPAEGPGPSRLFQANQAGVGDEDSDPDDHAPYGIDLAPGRVVQMTPDQIFDLYLLNVNATGGYYPLSPLEDGSDVVDVDKHATQVDQAKKNLAEIQRIELDKLARGEIRYEECAFHKKWLFHMFDLAIQVKGKEEILKEKLAVDQLAKDTTATLERAQRRAKLFRELATEADLMAKNADFTDKAAKENEAKRAREVSVKADEFLKNAKVKARNAKAEADYAAMIIKNAITDNA